MRLERDVPLAPLTTLRLGGAAARVAVIEREEDVPEALAEAERVGVPVFVLGGGSNLVVGDEGTDALVLRMASRGVAVNVRDGSAVVTLAAGEPWDPFVTRAVGCKDDELPVVFVASSPVGAYPKLVEADVSGELAKKVYG